MIHNNDSFDYSVVYFYCTLSPEVIEFNIGAYKFIIYREINHNIEIQ